MSRPASPNRSTLMSPGFWLQHAALACRQVFGRRLRPLHLTPTQFMLTASAGWAGRDDRMMTSKVLHALVDAAW